MTTPAPTIGVCGFGRCGSTMLMAMLAAGGMAPVDDSSDVSFEVMGGVDSLRTRPPAFFAGRAVKLLDSITYYGLPPAASWRFVWLDRNATEQAKSQVEFGRVVAGIAMAADAVERVAESYRRDRPRVLGELRKRGPVTVLRYEDVLANPVKAAKRLRRDVWPALDVAAATAVVHHRDGACKYLAYELGDVR